MIHENYDDQNIDGNELQHSFGPEVDDQLAKAGLLLGHVSIEGKTVYNDINNAFIGRHHATENLLDHKGMSPSEARTRREWDITVPATEEDPALNVVLSAKYKKPEVLDYGYPEYTAVVTGHDKKTDDYDVESPDARPANTDEMLRVAELLVSAQETVADSIIDEISAKSLSTKGLKRFFRRKSA